MNLTLSIKQKFFDEIKAGHKKYEEREITPKSAKRYLLLDENGDSYLDENGFIAVRPYKTITFLTGAYKGIRPRMVVEVLSAQVELMVDEEDQYVTYEKDGKEYIYSIINYSLGRILSK